MKKWLKVITVMALIIALLVPTALAASRAGRIIAASARVYNSKKTAVGTLARGTSITVTGKSGSWVRFKYKGGTYYTKLSNIMLKKGAAAVTTKDAYFEFVTKSSYKKGTYYKATLASGTKVYVVGKSGSKYLVRNVKGSAYGYISTSAVSRT